MVHVHSRSQTSTAQHHAIILKHKQCRRVILPKKRAITTNGMTASVYGC